MNDNGFRFCDTLGPKSILHIHEPAIGLKAILVVDNVATGPAIGGVRLAPDVSLEECFRLARAMTFKNAAAGLPHGGGKSVIFGDPAMDAAKKETLIRAFARAIGPTVEYIAGPDMGTNETAMAWIRDEIGRAAGLPREVGGIPLDEIGATGFGVAVACEAAAPFAGLSLDGARIVVQGYGAVGRNAARYLERKGAKLVGVADRGGAVANPDGLDLAALTELTRAGHSVGEYAGGKVISHEELIGLPCDIWIPAARPDVLRADNVDRLNCKLVVQGANIPATAEAERMMFERGIVSVPDFIANAGGVICASVEHRGGGEAMAFTSIEEKIRRNTRLTLERARSSNAPPVQAATALAMDRLQKMMKLRRWR